MKISKIRNAPVMLALFSLLTLSITSANAQDKTSFSKGDATNYILTSSKSNSNSSENLKRNFNSISDSKNEKSGVLAGFMSAVVPGAGEIYSKSYIKAAAFLAIEAGMWIGYSSYQKKSNDQTDVYEAEANAHWSVRRYATWLHNLNLAESGNIDPNDPSLDHLYTTIHALESVHFSHTLPAYGVQQYYELIGKYHSFVAGWDDAPNPDQYNVSNYINWTSPLFESYAVDRQLANTYYDRSQNFIYGVIINHILSAADAVWSASIFNNNLKFRTNFKMTDQYSPVTSKWVLVPTTNLTVTF